MIARSRSTALSRLAATSPRRSEAWQLAPPSPLAAEAVLGLQHDDLRETRLRRLLSSWGSSCAQLVHARTAGSDPVTDSGDGTALPPLDLALRAAGGRGGRGAKR